MNRRYFIILIVAAIISVFLIMISMWQGKKPIPTAQELFPHPTSPFASSIFGVGIVEASSNNIAIGSPLSRVVEEVFVKVDDKITKGEELLVFDNADLQAELKAHEIAEELANAKVKKLEEMPRPEDQRVSEAAYKTAEENWKVAKSAFDRMQGLDPKAMSVSEKNMIKSEYQEAASAFESAKARLDKVREGVWKPDIDIAKLEAEQAKAQMELVKAQFDKTIVRSPIDGTVLQVNINAGEVPSIHAPLMLIGNVDELHLKVSINQFDAPLFEKNAKAVAFMQGDARFDYPLEFVRVEPIITSKETFTGDVTEVVDTRVLKVIYKFKEMKHPVFVGQQMDVFIEK